MIPIILVANKVDLSQRRKVSTAEGVRLAEELGVHYMETSAKDPPGNIDNAFREVRSRINAIMCVISDQNTRASISGRTHNTNTEDGCQWRLRVGETQVLQAVHGVVVFTCVHTSIYETVYIALL